MKRKSKTTGVLAIFFGAALVFLLFLSFDYTTPLSRVEANLVGNWSQVSLPREEFLTGMQFESDRKFQSMDGEFTGRWWINNGKLNVKYWRNESTNVPFANAWKEFRGRTESWFLDFEVAGDRANLSHFENSPDFALLRMR